MNFSTHKSAPLFKLGKNIKATIFTVLVVAAVFIGASGGYYMWKRVSTQPTVYVGWPNKKVLAVETVDTTTKPWKKVMQKHDASEPLPSYYSRVLVDEDWEFPGNQ